MLALCNSQSLFLGNNMMTANASTCTLAESCLLQTCEFGETSCFWTVDENVRITFSRYLLMKNAF